MNILCLYNATQTYTNAVYDHLRALADFSKDAYFFCDLLGEKGLGVELSKFDAVCVHFSIRLPFDQLPQPVVDQLGRFSKLKFLFLQDEYDNTHRTWEWIRKVGFQLVFTVVPTGGIDIVYPATEFPNTRFVTNLTGYAPPLSDISNDCSLPSSRALLIGYRGRPLPARYGALGFEKVQIGRLVQAYCKGNGIRSDISWTEGDRIYGSAWTKFVASCRSMLGTESGSNVFDWDGRLNADIREYVRSNPQATSHDVYLNVIKPKEIDGLMNQISPKMFEAIAAHTILVLFEGNYSGILVPDKHFIPLSKDGRNLPSVIDKLRDLDYVDEMADAAYTDIIVSRKHDYRAFSALVDGEVANSNAALRSVAEASECSAKSITSVGEINLLSMSPIRALTGNPSGDPWISFHRDGSLRISPYRIFGGLPQPLRTLLLPILRRLRRRFDIRT